MHLTVVEMMGSNANELSREGRVLLLFDASPGSMVALHTALGLIDRSQRIEALYIEERDWLRSAGFAFSAEVGALSGAVRQHDSTVLEQRLAARRERVRRALLAASGTECRLDIRRGRSLEEVLGQTGPDDLLVVGRVGFSSHAGRRLGSLALELVRRAQGPVLLSATETPALGGPLAVLLDEPGRTTELLQAAARQAAGHRLGLLVLVAFGGADETALSDWLGSTPVPVKLYRLPGFPDPLGHVLARQLARSAAGEVLVSRRGRLIQSPAAARVLARLPASVRVLP
jgi:nucleotide-binding universal stress UspA family protein